MGKKITLQGVTLSDTTIPILRDDERLTQGSLILTDLTHSLTAPGLPADGGPVHNIAWQEAQALTGSGDQASLASTFRSTFTAPHGAFERSSRGALHGVVSQTDQGGQTARIEGAPGIMAYLAANPTRAFACFLWARPTRVPLSTGNLFDTGIGNLASFSGNNLFLGRFASQLAPTRLALTASSWTGAPNATASLNALYEAAWGNLPPYNGLNPDAGASYVLYQVHLIDIAASGLSYSDLSQRDLEAFNRFFGPGGRYEGDSTALDPASYP